MSIPLSRREALSLVPVSVLASASPFLASISPEEAAVLPPVQNPATAGNPLPSSFPSQDPQLIFAMVSASHGSLEKVKELLAVSTDLAKAGWDWGFGDWETALGAAAHTGQREIALLLMENGARADIFVHAMLGHLDAVKAITAAQPGIQKTLGPHGITLAQHARLGGEAAKPTLDFLLALGGADTPRPNLAITDEEKENLIGKYSYGSGETDVLVVLKDQRGNLSIKAGSTFSRSLRRVGSNEFETSGSLGVKIVFSGRQKQADTLSIFTPAPLVTAKRVL